MKHLDEYRDVELAKALINQIQQRASRRWVLMDVCGGQTHSLVRSGIEQALTDHVELIHGPGCPVCVTPAGVIDFAIALSKQGDTIVATFGDMMRVPGSSDSLIDARQNGGDVRMVYSPIDAVLLAMENPSKTVIFVAVGFETTAPATALAVVQASQKQLRNFVILPAHVRVQPAMEAIMEMPENRVQGFLAAGHVCTVTGFASYSEFVNKYSVPVVVTGFEPIDLLKGILEVVTELENGESKVVNRYQRSVASKGNETASDLIRQVYRASDQPWRGFGIIPAGGLAMREKWSYFNAYARFKSVNPESSLENSPCRGADVMSGRIKPKDCAAFGDTCTPMNPLGAPMVSSEGACAAYYRFDPVKISLPSGLE